MGEIRRVLNSFLQMIEQDGSNSIIIAATNHPEILDYALFRRFDDIVEYELPRLPQIAEVLKNSLGGFPHSVHDWGELARKGEGLSYAEVARAAEDAIKDAIVHDRKEASERDVAIHLQERKALRNRNQAPR